MKYALPYMLLVLFLWGVAVSSCKETRDKKAAHKRESNPPRTTAGPGKSGVRLEEVTTVPAKALSVEEARRRLSDENVQVVAAVLWRDTKKSYECFAKQHQHGKSCPPPYYTFADVRPFSEGERPEKVGARMLVKLEPVPDDLQVGEFYLFDGVWCPDGKLAKFCAEKIRVISPKKKGNDGTASSVDK